MAQQFEEESGLKVLIHRIEGMRDGACWCSVIDLHSDRGLQNLAGQPMDIIGHGCREQQSLSPGRHVSDDLPDIRQKAHVEYAVRLIQ
jgi:hypothetical protein